MLLRWRKEYEARGEDAFTEKRTSSDEEALEAGIAELERFCGKLALENEILKRGCRDTDRAKAQLALGDIGAVLLGCGDHGVP